MLRYTVLGALLSSALLSLTPHANATPITYGIRYEVEYFGPGIPVDPRVLLGDQYYGYITFDDALLLSEGINLPSSVSAFTTTFEDVTWTLGQPRPLSVFSGFRGPGGLGSSSPGFDIQDGQVVNLRGGVFGAGDIPFIDFSSDIRIPFIDDPTCIGAYCGNRPNSFWSLSPLGGFGGSMEMFNVPEPATAPMVVLGLALVGAMALRRPREKSDSRRRSSEQDLLPLPLAA